MARLQVSTAARRDLKQLWTYIAQNNLKAADETLDEIESVLVLLGRSPLLGRSRSELGPGLRSFPVGDYVIFYLSRKSAITVVRVLSGYRDLNQIFE